MGAGASLLFLIAGATAAPGGPNVEEKLCPSCETTGRIANDPPDARLVEQESKVLRCSWWIERDGDGRALPFLPCGRCLAPSKQQTARAEFDALAADVDAWLASRAEIDATLKPRDGFVHVETAHFVLTYGLPRVVTKDKKVYDLHAGAHLYAERLEIFYAWFQQTLGYTDAEARVLKHHVFLLPDLRTLVTAGRHYAHIETDRAGRAVGDPSVFVTWRDKSVFGTDDDAFHRHVVHHVSHLLQGVAHLMVWLSDRAGWLDEGLAHWCEMELFDKSGNTCNTESIEGDVADLDWEPLVRRRVAEGKTLALADFMAKPAHTLTLDEHLFAFAYTDYLMTQDPKKVFALARAVKEYRDLRDELRAQFDVSVVGLQPLLEEWVKETYRVKPLGG